MAQRVLAASWYGLASMGASAVGLCDAARRPSRSLGKHTAEILSELGYDEGGLKSFVSASGTKP